VRALGAWPPFLVALGLAAGTLVLLLEPTLYRAETTLVVERGGAPVTGGTHALAQLVTSKVVLDNVEQQLGGVDSGRVHVEDGSNGVLRIAYDARHEVDAARVAQQIAVDFEGLVASRYPALRADVFDPVHATGRVSPHPLRDVGLGLLAGLAAAAIVSLRRHRGPAALRERGHWRVSALSQLVESSAAGHPDRVDDWRAYIAVLRAQSEGDLVPYALDGLVREVFAPVLPREA
jgi:hypothetical protein